MNLKNIQACKKQREKRRYPPVTLITENTHYHCHSCQVFSGIDFGKNPALFLEVPYPRFQMTMRVPWRITKPCDLLSQRDRLGRCSGTAFAFRRSIRLSDLRFEGEGRPFFSHQPDLMSSHGHGDHYGFLNFFLSCPVLPCNCKAVIGSRLTPCS